jgi:hypothetical protein
MNSFMMILILLGNLYRNYPIVDIRRYHNYKIPFYYCKLRADIENAYLESIEHHCKYKEPDIHKSELLRLLSTKGTKKEG